MGTPLGRGGGGTHHGLVMSQTWFSDRQEGDLYVGSNSVSAPAQCVLVMEDLNWPYLGIEEREGCIRCSCTVKRLRSPHYSPPPSNLYRGSSTVVGGGEEMPGEIPPNTHR